MHKISQAKNQLAARRDYAPRADFVSLLHTSLSKVSQCFTDPAGWRNRSLIQPVEQSIGHVLKRAFNFRSAERDGGTWHAIDDAGVFVLRDGPATPIPNLQQTLGAIAAHSRQNGAYAPGAAGRGDRVKEMID
jgi:hypothetical protein